MTEVTERKLYIITRRDLEPSLRAVMAVHVAANFAFGYGMENENDVHALMEWSEYGPPVVLMTVRNRQRLEALADKFDGYTYTDPDLNDGVCAVALYELNFKHDHARLARFADAGNE